MFEDGYRPISAVVRRKRLSATSQHSKWQEWIAGTDPKDATFALRLTGGKLSLTNSTTWLAFVWTCL